MTTTEPAFASGPPPRDQELTAFRDRVSALARSAYGRGIEGAPALDPAEIDQQRDRMLAALFPLSGETARAADLGRDPAAAATKEPSPRTPPDVDPLGALRWDEQGQRYAVRISVSAQDQRHWWLDGDLVTDEAVRAMNREWHPDVASYRHALRGPARRADERGRALAEIASRIDGVVHMLGSEFSPDGGRRRVLTAAAARLRDLAAPAETEARPRLPHFDPDAPPGSSRWIADRVEDAVGGDCGLADAIGDGLSDDLAPYLAATPPAPEGEAAQVYYEPPSGELRPRRVWWSPSMAAVSRSGLYVELIGRGGLLAEVSGALVTARSLPDDAVDLVPGVRLPAPAGPQAEGIDGASLIVVERLRQIEQERWTPGHDRQHTRGGPRWPSSLAHAATAYVHRNNAWWPWPNRPTFTISPTAADRARELTKAGALIAADLDLLNGTAPARLRAGSGPWAAICGEQWRTGDHVWTCTEPPGHTKGGCRDGNLPCGCEHDAGRHTCADAAELNDDDPAPAQAERAGETAGGER